MGAEQQLGLRLFGEIVDVLGRSRPIVRRWPDGSWECPFCCAATDPARVCGGRREGYAANCGAEVHCQNPGCFANPHYPAARAAEEMAAAERRAAEERRRAELRDWSARRSEEDARERIARIEEIRKEATAKGACVRCALDGARYGAPKFVKHRSACPRERR